MEKSNYSVPLLRRSIHPSAHRPSEDERPGGFMGQANSTSTSRTSGGSGSPGQTTGPDHPRKGPGRRSRRSVKTLRLAVCAVFCALGVAVLGLGAVVEVIDMTASAMAALVFLPILVHYGSGYALACWGVTSLLGIILMPQSLAPWLFLCLLGYYPALKKQIDRLPRPAAFVLKLALVCAALCLYLFLFRLIMMGGAGSLSEVFLTGFGEQGGKTSLAWLFVGLCFLTFFAFDLLIDKLYMIYRLRWQKRIGRWLT